MFGALTKAITSLWGQDEEPVSRNNHPQGGAVGKIDDVWYFDGKITSLHNGYGLVNDEVYFSQDLVTGGGMPQVGQPVYVCARRRQGTGGWRAETVTISSSDTQWTDTSMTDETESCWEPKTSSGQQEIIAVVTSTTNDCCRLNETISFCFYDVADELYVPCMGDTVTAVIVTDDTTFRQHAVDIKPLRRFEFEGQVTAAMSDHGYIVCPGGVDVYFSYNACGEGYSPHRGDLVSGAATETTRGQCQWRALSVKHRCIEKQSTDWLNRPPVWSAEQSLRELLAEKEGISVTGKLDFGELNQGDDRSTTVTIQNSGIRPRRLISCNMLGSSDSQFDITLQHTSDVKVSVAPGMSTSVIVQCHAKYLGMDKRLLIFNFEGFKIGRHVTVRVRDPRQSVLDPTSAYQRSHAGSRYHAMQETQGESWLVPGQRPTRRKTSSRQSTRLSQYPVPEKLRTWLFTQGDLKQVVPVLTEPLCMDNYAERFSVLLHLEELQQEIDLLEFSLDRVCLRPVGEFLALAVPGLAEGRPSLLPGDRLVLSEPCEVEGGPEYEGYIHEVLKDEILLKFHNSFHQSYQGADYNCRFLLSRTTLRRCHQAAHCATQHGQRVLFPESLIPKTAQMKAAKQTSSSQSSGLVKVLPVVGIRKCPLGVSTGDRQQKHKFFNEKLNSRQRAAVMRILQGQSRPTPYILFGPPGTGKTMTVVEAVLQIFEHVPSSRLVVCAPSNSAADLLVWFVVACEQAERLHSSGRVKTSEMVRLNAFQRIEENIDTTVQPYCRNADELELVARHRIIVCTCSSAAQLGSLSLSSGHFTHVFVDEAGQATEPECLISMCLLAGSDGQTVLAGDPLQLGAVLRSHPAKQYHLDLSLLERLIQRPLYRRDESKFADHGSYDPFLVTKLIQNYRSHPALLQLPSELFYDGELQCSGDTSVTECMCDWDMLPNKDGCPLIFHGMRGEDIREGNSPSWFNPVEVMQVVKYVQALVSSNHNLTFDDIGVITPYRKQVEKIRLLIDRLGMEKVKVGSVEEFQGQERLAMIISTVRSNESQLGSDRVHNLGFLSNPKRFNVAITRAQALLIIVGNPHILAQDPYWQALIRFCVSRGTYIGCDLPDVEDWLHPQESEAATADVGDEKDADIINLVVVDGADNQGPDVINGQVVDDTENQGPDISNAQVVDTDDKTDDTKDINIAGNTDSDITNCKQDDVDNKQISNGKGVDSSDEHSADITIDEEVDVADATAADIANRKHVDVNRSPDVSRDKMFDAANNQYDDVTTNQEADVANKQVNNGKGVDSADKLGADVTIGEEVDVADNTDADISSKQVDIITIQGVDINSGDGVDSADNEADDIAEAVDVADNINADNTNVDTADADKTNSKQVDVADSSYADITNGKQDVADKQDDDITFTEDVDDAHNTDVDVSSHQGTISADRNDTTGDIKISGDIGGDVVMYDSVNDIEVCDVTRNDTVYEDCSDVTIYEDNRDVNIYEDSRNVTVYEDSRDVTTYEDDNDDTVLLDVPACLASRGDTNIFHDNDTKVCMDVGNGTVCDDIKEDMTHLHKNGDIEACKENDTVNHDDRANTKVCHDTEELDDTRHNVFDDTTGDTDVVDDTRRDTEVGGDTVNDTEVSHDTRKDVDDDTVDTYLFGDKCRDTNVCHDTSKDVDDDDTVDTYLFGDKCATNVCHDTRKDIEDDDTVDTYLFGDKCCDTDISDIKKVQTVDPRNDSTVAPPTSHSRMVKGNKRHSTCDNRRNQDVDAKHVSLAKEAGQGDGDGSDLGYVSMSVWDSRYNHNNSNLTDEPAITATPTTAKPSLLEKKINRQLQYYFGDFNLMKDVFLQKHISNDAEGWVDLSLLVTFKRLQSLSTDCCVITTALSKCTANVVEVSRCGTKVRRSCTNPLSTDSIKWKECIKSRSVAVEGCGKNFSETGCYLPREHIDDLQGFFEFYGDVEHIQQGIWKRVPGQRDFSELDLVVFHKRESAEKLARNAPIQRSDRTLLVYFGDAVQDEAVEWLYDLHVRKIKKCRIQPIGSRRQTRASSARATDKGGRGHPNTASRSQHTSNHPRNNKQQIRSFFSEQSRGSSHGRKDSNRRRGGGEHGHTGMDGVGRGSSGDLTRAATCHEPGWTGHAGKDHTRHDTTAGRGIHVAQPLGLRRPRFGSDHSNVGAVCGSLRSADECTSPSIHSSRGDDDLILKHTNLSPKSVTSLQSDASPVRDTVAKGSNLHSEIERSICTGGTATGSDIIPYAHSPVSLRVGNDDSPIADEYNALNQTDSDVIIEESESEEDEDWA